MANDAFYSPKRRLIRAKKHICDLDAEIKQFLGSKPHAHVIEPDDQGINQVHKVKFTKPLPADIADIAVDALDNLRSSLDHTGYAVATIAGHPNSKSAYFPFGESQIELENTIKGRCKDIPADIVTLFRSFQPYKGGDNLLWSLNKIRGANQHKILTPIGILTGGMRMKRGILRAGPAGSASIPMPRWDRSKHEIVFGIVGPGGTFEYEIDISFTVAFDEVEVMSGQPAMAVLNALAGKVESIILATVSGSRGTQTRSPLGQPLFASS